MRRCLHSCLRSQVSLPARSLARARTHTILTLVLIGAGCENAKAMMQESSLYNYYMKPATAPVTYPPLPPNADI